MRRRYQLNLQTESEIESDLSDYLERFPQGSKRSEEIRRFCLIGFQMMIKGKTEEEAVINSYDPGLQRAISTYAKAEQQKTQESNQISELITLLTKNSVSQVKDSPNTDKTANKEMIYSVLEELTSSQSLSTRNTSNSNLSDVTVNEEKPHSSRANVDTADEIKPISNTSLNKRYTPNHTEIDRDFDTKEPSEESVVNNYHESPKEYLFDAEDMDIDDSNMLNINSDDDNDDIVDPLSRLGF